MIERRTNWERRARAARLAAIRTEKRQIMYGQIADMLNSRAQVDAEKPRFD